MAFNPTPRQGIKSIKPSQTASAVAKEISSSFSASGDKTKYILQSKIIKAFAEDIADIVQKSNTNLKEVLLNEVYTLLNNTNIIKNGKLSTLSDGAVGKEAIENIKDSIKHILDIIESSSLNGSGEKSAYTYEDLVNTVVENAGLLFDEFNNKSGEFMKSILGLDSSVNSMRDELQVVLSEISKLNDTIKSKQPSELKVKTETKTQPTTNNITRDTTKSVKKDELSIFGRAAVDAVESFSAPVGTDRFTENALVVDGTVNLNPFGKASTSARAGASNSLSHGIPKDENRAVINGKPNMDFLGITSMGTLKAISDPKNATGVVAFFKNIGRMLFATFGLSVIRQVIMLIFPFARIITPILKLWDFVKGFFSWISLPFKMLFGWMSGGDGGGITGFFKKIFKFLFTTETGMFVSGFLYGVFDHYKDRIVDWFENLEIVKNIKNLLVDIKEFAELIKTSSSMPPMVFLESRYPNLVSAIDILSGIFIGLSKHPWKTASYLVSKGGLIGAFTPSMGEYFRKMAHEGRVAARAEETKRSHIDAQLKALGVSSRGLEKSYGWDNETSFAKIFGYDFPKEYMLAGVNPSRPFWKNLLFGHGPKTNAVVDFSNLGNIQQYPDVFAELLLKLEERVTGVPARHVIKNKDNNSLDYTYAVQGFVKEFRENPTGVTDRLMRLGLSPEFIAFLYRMYTKPGLPIPDFDEYQEQYLLALGNLNPTVAEAAVNFLKSYEIKSSDKFTQEEIENTIKKLARHQSEGLFELYTYGLFDDVKSNIQQEIDKQLSETQDGAELTYTKEYRESLEKIIDDLNSIKEAYDKATGRGGSNEQTIIINQALEPVQQTISHNHSYSIFQNHPAILMA